MSEREYLLRGPFWDGVRQGFPRGLAVGVVVCGLVWLAMHLTGCGASALRAHASAAAVLTVAHEGAREVLVATVDAQAAECEARPEAERAPCAETLRAVAEPAAVAVDGVRAGLTVYREAVTVAAAAEAGEDVLSALAVALARVVREWDTVAAALSRLGVDVPPLPPIVRGLLDALAGGQ